jgi:hypothetical protein
MGFGQLAQIAHPALRERRGDQLDHHLPRVPLGIGRQRHHQQILRGNRHPVTDGGGLDDIARAEGLGRRWRRGGGCLTRQCRDQRAEHGEGDQRKAAGHGVERHVVTLPPASFAGKIDE